MRDTIFALATVRGRSGIAVVRVSGPGTEGAVRAMTGGLPAPRRASLRVLKDPSTGEELDHALVLVFSSGASFTGEAMAEFHLHGSPAVIDGVVWVLAGLDGLRPAEPGEFTRRALENDRLDLTEVEGLGDLLAAETAAQRRLALRLMRGELSARAAGWRADLIRAQALLAVSLDFADEDVPSDVRAVVRALVGRVRDEISREVAGSPAAERLRDGFEVAIVGLPNSGKSTLLNRLAGRDAAIVSELPGTTRDVIEVRMDLDGLPVTVLDTAGLHASTDVLERAGMDRARDRASAADLRIFLTVGGVTPVGLDPAADDIVVEGKADLTGAPGGVSGLTGVGVEALLSRVATILGARAANASSVASVRQRQALVRAIPALDSVVSGLDADGAEEVAADSVRMAIAALDALVGKVGVEDILDVVFASFCLGK
jgi:tRNA modification GTPase